MKALAYLLVAGALLSAGLIALDPSRAQVGFGDLGTSPAGWQIEWPETDFDSHSVPFNEILSGGPPKDGIPSIVSPIFAPVADESDLEGREPVIGIEINGDARAYPLQILMWHEIVNDVVGDVPVTVTYCPLCNAAIVFEREYEGRLLEFGTTGKLRFSDLVMYDRQTESWWQQFLGEAIVGEMTGARLTMRPSRLQSFDTFKELHPDGRVLQPDPDAVRSYGRNPYEFYDTRDQPYGFYSHDMRHEGLSAMAYVIAVEEQAWTLELLKQEGQIESGDLLLSWSGDTASALDSSRIAEGWNIGDVVVQRRAEDGVFEDVVYDLTFAFAFEAFRPNGVIVSE